MKITFQTIKPMLLIAAILVGLVVQNTRANDAQTRTAAFTGGCVWCLEGDSEVVPGAIGEPVAIPAQRQVTHGSIGRLEAVTITYEPSDTSYPPLVHLILRSVGPTHAGGKPGPWGHHLALFPKLWAL